MAEGDTLNYLEGEVHGGEKLTKPLSPVPTERFLLDRHAAEAHRRPPELLLLRQGICSLILLLNVRRCDELSPGRSRQGTLGLISRFARLLHPPSPDLEC